MDIDHKRRTIDLSNPDLEVQNQWWKEGWWTQRDCTGRAWWQHHKMRQAWHEIRNVYRVVIRLLYEAARERDRLLAWRHRIRKLTKIIDEYETTKSCSGKGPSGSAAYQAEQELQRTLRESWPEHHQVVK